MRLAVCGQLPGGIAMSPYRNGVDCPTAILIFLWKGFFDEVDVEEVLE